MNQQKYIGMDVHQATLAVAVFVHPLSAALRPAIPIMEHAFHISHKMRLLVIRRLHISGWNRRNL